MKIMLIGTYSSLNKGDFAMQQALIKEISKRMRIDKKVDDISFEIFSPYPELDKDRYSQYIKNNFNNISVTYKKNWLYLTSPNLFINLKNFNLFKDYEIVIDVSGDTIGESYSLYNLNYRLIYLNLLNKILKKKMILAPQSVGPFTYSKFLFKKTLQDINMIYARDPLSYKYLQDLGLKNSSMTGDLAFLLDKKDTELNRHYLEEIKRIDGIKIGLNLSKRVMKDFYRNLNKSPNTQNMIKNMKNNVDIVKIGTNLCNELCTKFNIEKIIFIPHVFGPIEFKDDRIVGRSIYENLPDNIKEKFILIEDEMTHEELKAIISEVDIFIGSRMHACIGSISTGVPFINIAYSDKSLGMISQYIGLPELCVDVRTIKNERDLIDKIFSSLEYIMINKEEIKKILIQRTVEIKNKTEKTIDEIYGIITECKVNNK